MKTTKEQRDIWREWAIDGALSYDCIMAVIDEAERLEKENAELRAKLNEAYERAAQVCEPSIEDWRHAEGDIESINVCQQNSALAKAIRALKEKP